MTIDFISDINKNYGKALNYPLVDDFMVKILWYHFGFFSLLVAANSVFKLAANYPSPLSWRVISIPEGIVALGIALLATLLPSLLFGKVSNHYLWRAIVTVAFVFYSYLFVFISGGSIEMHFHFFIIAALIVMYADWRLGWILLVLTALHHGILNYIQPGWVYFYGQNDLSVISHSLPVLVAVLFTTTLCENYRKSVIMLETARSGLETEVSKRTTELEKARHELDRRAKIMELEGKTP